MYREPVGSYALHLPATGNKPRSFFELCLSENFLGHLLTDESEFLMRFHSCSAAGAPSLDFMAQRLPAMDEVISQMQHSPYQGHLKGMYLETKAIELFLLQVKQLDGQSGRRDPNLNSKDVERLHEISQYLERHYDQPCSIAMLAKRVGINQMKLKNERIPGTV